jgi:hypothetical protein
MRGQRWELDISNNSIKTEETKDVILSINSITITPNLISNIIDIHNSNISNSMPKVDAFLSKKGTCESIIKELIIETLYSNYYDKVNYERIKKLSTGTWVFAGELIPLQFSKFITAKNPRYYNMDMFTPEQWERFSKFTEFKSMDGSTHSTKLSGCRIISDEYAEWFNKNECWKLLPQNNSPRKWEMYEQSVRDLAFKDHVSFEGI